MTWSLTNNKWSTSWKNVMEQILSPERKSFKSSVVFVITCWQMVEWPKQLTNDSRRFGDDERKMERSSQKPSLWYSFRIHDWWNFTIWCIGWWPQRGGAFLDDVSSRKLCQSFWNLWQTLGIIVSYLESVLIVWETPTMKSWRSGTWKPQTISPSSVNFTMKCLVGKKKFPTQHLPPVLHSFLTTDEH